MSQSSQQKVFCDNPSTKTRVVAQQKQTLHKIFQHHGNQFLKWNFLPFLHHKERSSLRTSCTLFQKFIPSPQYVYTNNKNFGLFRATARLETITGYVETRGYAGHGGDSSRVEHHLQSNVVKIWSTTFAFAALKKSGKVITWGSQRHGGNSSHVSSELQCGVIQICGNKYAFAALKQGGKVITWGSSNGGGDSSAVSVELQSGVTSIVGNFWAFAALKSNGKVISWGSSHFGGDSAHLSSLRTGVIKLQAIKEIGKFRATKSDGSIIEWP